MQLQADVNRVARITVWQIRDRLAREWDIGTSCDNYARLCLREAGMARAHHAVGRDVP